LDKNRIKPVCKHLKDVFVSFTQFKGPSGSELAVNMKKMFPEPITIQSRLLELAIESPENVENAVNRISYLFDSYQDPVLRKDLFEMLCEVGVRAGYMNSIVMEMINVDVRHQWIISHEGPGCVLEESDLIEEIFHSEDFHVPDTPTNIHNQPFTLHEEGGLMSKFMTDPGRPSGSAIWKEKRIARRSGTTLEGLMRPEDAKAATKALSTLDGLCNKYRFPPGLFIVSERPY